MPTQPCSQCFFPNSKQLVGEESQSMALHQKRSPGNKVDTHKDHGKALSYQQCEVHSKAFGTSKVGLAYIENSAIMHFIIQSALFDCSFLIVVCYIRLVYRMSNFQTAAIVLTSFVKDTFCLQLHQSNSKFMWLASKKRTKVLGIGNSFLYQYFSL